MDGARLRAAHRGRDARRNEIELLQGWNEHEVRAHVRGVRPGADERVERRSGIQATQLARKCGGLILRTDDVVPLAPPELERHAGPSDGARVGDRAAPRIGSRQAPRRTADLLAREYAQPETDRITPPAQTAAVAAKPREVAVTRGHVGDRIECCGAGEELGMTGNQ